MNIGNVRKCCKFLTIQGKLDKKWRWKKAENEKLGWVTNGGTPWPPNSS